MGVTSWPNRFAGAPCVMRDEPTVEKLQYDGFLTHHVIKWLIKLSCFGSKWGFPAPYSYFDQQG